MGEGESTELEVYVAPDGADGLSYSSSDASVASIAKKEYSNDTYIIQAKATGTATITLSFAGSDNYEAAKEDITITVTVLPAPIKVTTNAAKEGDPFTEASFNMPASDATIDYELVRDMAQLMTTKVGNAADGADYRIRIKKDNQTGKFVPAEMNPQAMAGLITVTDDIEEKTLTNVTDYTVSIFAVDDHDQPIGDAIAFTDLVPGRYVAIATAADGSAYDGATEQSNVFVLYQGYEVEVPAKEMITYYKDEPLYVEDEDAVLYTISSVNGDQAVLSEKSDAMPSNTPMLVYNNSDVAKVILLIPCNEPNLDITVAPEFKGTNEEKAQGATGNGPWNMAANTKYYGCNGNDFVWIKNAGDVAANRCWIEINTANAPSRLTLVFEKEEATDIDSMEDGRSQMEDGAWYDLSGRKLDGMPATKGVYIKDGKKIVIK